MENTKGFMRLLKKYVPFYWDDQVQRSFEALKKALTTSPLLSPSHFSKDFILYLVASDTIIGTILVQEDECQREHPIYYLSRALANNEMSYVYVEKLAIAVVHDAQRLRHYLVSRKTLVLTNLNPFQYILSHRLINRKF